MMRQIFKYTLQTTIYVLAFLGLVWILLGIPPMEAYQRTRMNVGKIGRSIGGFAGNMKAAITGMKGAADNQLQSASDRLHGRDPYAKMAEKFDATVSGEH